MLRSISGGPVYISDAVGRTDPRKLWPLIYKDGRVIRCEETANPTEDILTLDPTREAVPLKLWNTAGGGAGAVAAFHIHRTEPSVTGSLQVRDVPALEGTACLVYEHFFSKRCFVLLPEERQEFSLKAGQCALYLLIPLTGSVTPIGLINKYISIDTVLALRDTGRSTLVSLKEGGTFAFYAKNKPQQVILAGTQKKSCSLRAEMFTSWNAETVPVK